MKRIFLFRVSISLVWNKKFFDCETMAFYSFECKTIVTKKVACNILLKQKKRNAIKNSFFVTLVKANHRSSRSEVFRKKGVLRNFSKFTGKHLCRPVTLFKKGLWHRCFPVNLAKFLRTSFFTNHLQWQLLE